MNFKVKRYELSKFVAMNWIYHSFRICPEPRKTPPERGRWFGALQLLQPGRLSEERT